MRSIARWRIPLALGVWGAGFVVSGSLDFDPSSRLGLQVLGVMFLVAAVVSAAGSARRTGLAVMRLDHFLPFLRKPKKVPPPHVNPQWRPWDAIARTLPGDWSTAAESTKPGRLRRILKGLGPSFAAAPLRRASQVVCLITFLVLFFWVCWPYGARPRVPLVISDCRFESLDEHGALLFHAGDAAGEIPADREFYLAPPAESQPRSPGQPRQAAGPVAVQSLGDGRFAAHPLKPLPPEWLDRFLLTDQTWELRDEPPGAWPAHYAEHLSRRSWMPPEIFLAIDPLVSVSTAIASRQWVWSLAAAAWILGLCLLIPRGFCGYVCPLGTLIDLFDGLIGKRIKRFRVADDGWWVHLKYYVLLATLVAAAGGVLISGYVAAIPVVTRGMLFLGEPLQSGLLRGWHLAVPLTAGQWLSLSLFVAVLALGLLKPRFWCKYVCPSGAVFSLGNLFRLTERKVESTCIHCNKCVEVCPFDAIKPDFTTRTTDCTLCQTCGGVCPTHAIKFVERGNQVELKVLNDPPTGETALGRRGFLSAAIGITASLAAGGTTVAARSLADTKSHLLPVRPPGSVPEAEFLQLCIRCGECYKVCPNNVLQPEGFQQGFDGLWTPLVNADWAGCESSCNACGQVCPTGAIRALPLDEKRYARMGLAIVNTTTCLPLAGKEACQLCVDECAAAGYHAIEFMTVHTKLDDQGAPVAGSGLLAPRVLPELCVGCGLCQTRCYGINVLDRAVLRESAIIVEAGEGNEDRLLTGSYRQRHEARLAGGAQPDRRFDFVVPDSNPADSAGAVPPAATDPSGSPLPPGEAGGDVNPFLPGGPAGTRVEQPRATIGDDPFGLKK